MVLAAALLVTAFAQAQSAAWLTAGGLRVKTRQWSSPQRSAHPRLLIVLHGDSPFAPPSYQYAFAERAAAALDDVVVVALLRPGYADDAGDRSDGERGEAVGDNYTPAVVDTVAAAVKVMAARVHASAVFLVGHSGGAAIAADVLGRHPKLADGALLLSCPCDLAAWRAHMAELQGSPLWRAPVNSLSPIALAAAVSPRARIRLVVGAEDRVAPPSLSQAYARALAARSVDARLTIAPHLPHDILLDPIALMETAALLSR